MSEPERQALSASLSRLDEALANRAPSLHMKLAPPASPAEIARLRAALNQDKVEVLEAWYLWHNGTTDPATSLLPLGAPLSIEEALEDHGSIQRVPFVDKLRKSAIKLMDDGSGDGFFLDVTSTKPTVFYHMLEDPLPLSYGSLDQFVNFIATGFEAGVLRTNESGALDYDIQAYEQFEAEHLRMLGSR